MIDDRTRYLQLAFNDDLAMAGKLVPTLPKDPRLILEAGTPFIKREGMRGVQGLRSLWPYNVLADLKTADGAVAEVEMAARFGASQATVLGSCPAETLNLFIAACAQSGVDSFVDLIGLGDPLGVLRKLAPGTDRSGAPSRPRRGVHPRQGHPVPARQPHPEQVRRGHRGRRAGWT